MPKFFVAEQKEISESLKELGVETVFSAGADLSPLFDGGASVSRVNHGVAVAVDEAGVRAGAYSTIYGRGGSAIEYKYITMRLDRPFLFLVRGEGGVPLFCGVVNQL